MANEKRLIDANALKDAFCTACSTNKRYRRSDEQCRDYIDPYGNGCFKMRLVDNTPTVDAVEVVHGRWVFGIANHREYMKCSVCLKSQTPTGVFTYCPNCGAKMDGGNEDG